MGWDIAITPQGPMLLEGNSYPDVHYPQRIYRRPYGEMRIGELLGFHMARMEAAWDAGNACIDAHGGYGYAEEYDIERKFRECRLYKTAPVNNNLVLAYVGQHVLGMPRSY